MITFKRKDWVKLYYEFVNRYRVKLTEWEKFKLWKAINRCGRSKRGRSYNKFNNTVILRLGNNICLYWIQGKKCCNIKDRECLLELLWLWYQMEHELI